MTNDGVLLYVILEGKHTLHIFPYNWHHSNYVYEDNKYFCVPAMIMGKTFKIHLARQKQTQLDTVLPG